MYGQKGGNAPTVFPNERTHRGGRTHNATQRTDTQFFFDKLTNEQNGQSYMTACHIYFLVQTRLVSWLSYKEGKSRKEMLGLVHAFGNTWLAWKYKHFWCERPKIPYSFCTFTARSVFKPWLRNYFHLNLILPHMCGYWGSETGNPLRKINIKEARWECLLYMNQSYLTLSSLSADSM